VAAFVHGADKQLSTSLEHRLPVYHVAGTSTSGVARVTFAAEGINEVDARAAVCTRRRLAFVEVRLALTTGESRDALTLVRTHLRQNTSVVVKVRAPGEAVAREVRVRGLN